MHSSKERALLRANEVPDGKIDPAALPRLTWELRGDGHLDCSITGAADYVGRDDAATLVIGQWDHAEALSVLLRALECDFELESFQRTG